jgi:hypothetical protein
MRLSGWKAVAPHRDSMDPKVLALVEPVLTALGADADPHCWIFWGDDPGSRWLIMAVTPAGLCSVNVRVNVPGEGPRAAGRLLRWTRVQVGELAVETATGGRMVLSSQVEGQVLRAVGGDVPVAAAFVASILAAMDGRPLPDLDRVTAPRGGRGARKVGLAGTPTGTRKPAATKPAATKPAATKPAAATTTSATRKAGPSGVPTSGRPKRGG